MKPDVLKATIERYNKYCANKRDDDFGRDPVTLIPVQRGPFYALKMYPGGPNTQGGPKKNAMAQVVDPFNKPIPHLYCVGELGSIYGFLYPTGGGNLCEMIIFGRIAGESIVNEKTEPTATTATDDLSVAATTAGATASSATSPSIGASAGSKDECLECHGPFTKLASAQPSYVVAGGEKVNPHHLVPHDAKDAKAIPECSNCHTPHPKTLTTKVDLSKLNVEWCYDSCHHQHNFVPCKKCHK